MKSKSIIAIVTALSSALIACQVEDLLQDKPGPRHDNIYTQVSKHDESGAFKDITGFDPVLQSQLIQMTFPVIVEGVQTNIDAQFSVMPIHIFEDGGEDKSGDYYVIEADFTAHNALLKDNSLFMKSMEVAVTPMSADDDILTEGTDVFFYDMPSPKTTIANTSYTDSHPINLNNRGVIGKIPYLTTKASFTYEDCLIQTYPLSKEIRVNNLYIQEKNITLVELNGDQYVLNYSDLYASCVDDRTLNLYIRKDTKTVDGITLPERLTEKSFMLENGYKNINCYEVKANGEQEIKLFYKDATGKLISSQSPKIIRCQYDGYDVECKSHGWWIRQQDQIGKTISLPSIFACISFASGYSWGVNKVYYREDLTTRLNTDSHCGVDYKYVVENLDSSKGIPRVAQSDLNGHATWVWHMPIKNSKFTAQQLLSNLFKIKVEVKPVYGKIGKLDKDISIDAAKSTTMQTSILSAPYRQKMTSIRFTNHGISPMMNVRLLTVPYLKWVEDGRPESEILQQREEPLMAGESITMPTVETSCYIACEEVDPQSLEIKSIRQSELIDVKVDSKSPQEIKLSTFDTSLVMVYKN